MKWAHQLNPLLDRRTLLSKLSTAFTLAAAAPLFDLTEPNDHERIALVLDDPRRLDDATITYAESVLQGYRRQGDVLGPQITLQTALAQRQVIGRLDAAAPATLQPRVLSVYAELSQIAGWQLFNLGDYRAAQYYYDDARTAAHNAHNVELVTYTLCTMSQLATWQDKPRVGIDHAIAAQAWAGQIDRPYARAYAADVAARAYAADQQADRCRQALDTVRVILTQPPDAQPVSSWWYFLDESFYWGSEGECALRLNQPDDALAAAATSLSLVDPANLHNYAHTLASQGEAHIQRGDSAEASRIIGDVARLTAANRSRRIEQRVVRMRQALEPWQCTKAVRELDDRLSHYRLSIGNDTTNKS